MSSLSPKLQWYLCKSVKWCMIFVMHLLMQISLLKENGSSWPKIHTNGSLALLLGAKRKFVHSAVATLVCGYVINASKIMLFRSLQTNRRAGDSTIVKKFIFCGISMIYI